MTIVNGAGSPYRHPGRARLWRRSTEAATSTAAVKSAEPLHRGRGLRMWVPQATVLSGVRCRLTCRSEAVVGTDARRRSGSRPLSVLRPRHPSLAPFNNPMSLYRVTTHSVRGGGGTSSAPPASGSRSSIRRSLEGSVNLSHSQDVRAQNRANGAGHVWEARRNLTGS